MATFKARKTKIQESLQTPDEEYTDLSPKGSVDSNIRQLVGEINGLSSYVTTSSCGGRIAVYLEGRTGSKGGGKWLYTSHEAIDLTSLDINELCRLLGLSGGDELKFPQNIEHNPRFVHFKFEPMILHILTDSHAAAQTALTAAMDAGFRESGISGIVSTNANKPITPMVAVRTTGLAFDCVVAFAADDDDDKVNLMVSADYLKTLVRVANERFETNDVRKERFRTALLSRVDGLRARANGPRAE